MASAVPHARHVAPGSERQKELKDGKHWALNQQLGYGDTEAKPYPGSPASSLPETPSILVLDDAGLGFRDAAQCWPDCLKDGVRPEGLEWGVLEMSRPLAAGVGSGKS